MRSEAACRLAASTVVAILIACCLSTRAEAAGGAYAVDDAQITLLNTCQVESWAAVADNKDLVFASAPACSVETIIPVELKAEVQRVRVDRFWASTISLQAKTNIVPVEVGKVGLATSWSTTFDMTATNVAATFLNVPLTYGRQRATALPRQCGLPP
ncbi:MAG: hypothetical protein GEU95_23125 [Rhizobiales bacterium]|nr:hypothetical protein [Hyphomicrobiales bacterium]